MRKLRISITLFLPLVFFLLAIVGIYKYRNAELMSDKPSNFAKLIAFFWPPKDISKPIVNIDIDCNDTKLLQVYHKYSGYYSVGISGKEIEKSYGTDSFPRFIIKFSIKEKNGKVIIDKEVEEPEYPIYGPGSGLVYYIYNVPNDFQVGDSVYIILDFKETSEMDCRILNGMNFFIRKVSDD